MNLPISPLLSLTSEGPWYLAIILSISPSSLSFVIASFIFSRRTGLSLLTAMAYSSSRYGVSTISRSLLAFTKFSALCLSKITASIFLLWRERIASGTLLKEDTFSSPKSSFAMVSPIDPNWVPSFFPSKSSISSISESFLFTIIWLVLAKGSVKFTDFFLSSVTVKPAAPPSTFPDWILAMILLKSIS